MRNPMGTILVQGGPRTMPERPRAVIATSASGNDVEVFGVRINLNACSFSTDQTMFFLLQICIGMMREVM